MKEVCGVWLTCLLLLGRKPAGTSEIYIDEDIESKSDPYHANMTSVLLSQRKRKVLSCTATVEPGATTHNKACTYFYDVFNSSNIVAYDGSNRNTS